jgi:hypothetical protein
MEEWLEWMARADGKTSSYDKLAELAVSSYNLDAKSRKAERVDRLQCFIRWWFSERNKMIKYKTYEQIAALVGKDHSNIVHHIHYRKQTALYDRNTRCIRDFLEIN